MGDADKQKADIYRWIKIGGLLSFLPFVLVAGPIAGFYIGAYLEKRFSLPACVSIALITAGFIGSFMEAVKVVKIALKTQEKS
jgi:hypothetical protein